MNKLKKLRIRLNLTLRELAEYVDMAHSTLQLLELGKRKFNEDHILKLCNFFDVTSEYLLGYSENGIGVYFDNSNDDEDHIYISSHELYHIQRTSKCVETIIMCGDTSLQKIVLQGHDSTSIYGGYKVFRSIKCNKEDAEIMDSVRYKLNQELRKLDLDQIEKVLKFINEYIK